MLSITKLRVGQEAYQLSGVAQSLDDYYTGAGEAQGQWVGGGADRLALAGSVVPDDVRAVLAGLSPNTGGLTPNGTEMRPHPRRVPGFDLTFKAPKSASVLYAISDDPRVQGAVIEAGEYALRSALAWLEREAVQVQRGSHNVAYLARLSPANRQLAGPRRLQTSGLVAASFRHRTSRAGDPYLHWHVLVANLVEGTDGKWSSLVHPEIYRHATAAGDLFQAAFRAELSRTLGVEWRPGRHVPEIAGIPQYVLDAFSKRSAEVEAWLAATGTANSGEGRQAAVLATRRNKREQEHMRFDQAWKQEGSELGWGPEMADGLIAASARRNPVDYQSAWRLEATGFDEHGQVEHYERNVTPDEWITELLRHLTAEQSTFTFPELIHAVTATLDQGATAETVERLARRVIGSTLVLEVHADDERRRWTSREIVDIEQRFIAALARTANPLASPTVVAAMLADRSDLGGDQRRAVAQILTSTSAVSVLVGPAGTGKTYTIDAIRSTLAATGISVLGAAPSARAALELAEATGMHTATLHRLLANGGPITPGALLVIDEAGMTDIRTLTRAVDRHLAAGGRVLLAGDHHQLPEIGAGGGFAYAARSTATVAELTVNRRQRNVWEQHALTHLRDGDVAAAVKAYTDHDRVTIADSPADLIEHAIALWAQARSEGHNPVLLAGTNELVDRLNQAAIDHLIQHGELDDCDQTAYGHTRLRVGERVVLRRNSALEHDTSGDNAVAINGQTGTVVAVTSEHDVTVALDHGPTLHLDEQYLRRGGHLTHAYALTSHRAQGGTWDLAIAVGADTLHREAAYVQLSRGAHTNHLLLIDPEITDLLAAASRDTARHDRGITHPDDEPAPADEHLTERLNRSGAKHLAHTLDRDVSTVDRLAATIPYRQLAALAQRATYAEHLATASLGYSREQVEQPLDRLTGIATRIAVGQQLSPADRHNVGVVTSVDDRDGTATLHFQSRSGHTAERTFAWADLRYIHTLPARRELNPTATRTLKRIAGELHSKLDAWDRVLTEHGSQPGHARLYTHASQRALELTASRLVADQPDWLRRHIGCRPADVAGARTWDNAVTAIARYHLNHSDGRTDPGGAHQLRTWLGQTRQWLESSDRATAAPQRVRSSTEIHDRRQVLAEILESAPSDCRLVIDQLINGQLALTDVDELLESVAAQQIARRDWILEHWPHVVEYAELERASSSPTVALAVT